MVRSVDNIRLMVKFAKLTRFKVTFSPRFNPMLEVPETIRCKDMLTMYGILLLWKHTMYSINKSIIC